LVDKKIVVRRFAQIGRIGKKKRFYHEGREGNNFNKVEVFMKMESLK